MSAIPRPRCFPSIGANICVSSRAASQLFSATLLPPERPPAAPPTLPLETRPPYTPPEDESPEQLRARLSKLVEHQARKILGLDDSKPLDFGRPLTDLGLDSLLAVELLNALSKSTGRQLPTSLVFNQPTIDAVTDYLVGDVVEPGTRP